MGKRQPRPDFDSCYADLYKERWGVLRQALIESPRYETLETPLLRPYHLDRASGAAARSLGAEPGDRVLDLCAAPGGKTLVLALALQGVGSLISNERSAARRERLRRVIDEHLPSELREIVTVTGHDAEKWGLHEQNLYDKVLLDAPCSSERHLLGQPKLLKEWTPSRSVQLARRQHAMLCAGWDALRPGGRLLYSTCALSPEENDGVVERLLKSRGKRVEIFSEEVPETEPTRFGRIALPDKTGGAGPLYSARIGKSPE